MRRLFYLTLLVSLLLSACAAAAPPPTDVPLAAAPSAVPTQPAPPTAPIIKTEFTPTDPTTVNLALGKPQFVEFFAFW